MAGPQGGVAAHVTATNLTAASRAERDSLPALLLALTLVTGVVDAVSILSLGRVFVANMTGNIVFAAFAFTGAPGFSLSASLFALAGFLAGAALGGLLIARTVGHRVVHLRNGVLVELLLAAIAQALAAATGTPFSPAVIDALAALLATALGIQNAVARKLAVPDLTTTVLTMTLTGLGADLRAILRPADADARKKGMSTLTRRLSAIAAMGAGAASGALLVLHVSPVAGLAVATGVLAAVAIAAIASVPSTGTRRAWRIFRRPSEGAPAENSPSP